MVTSFLGYPFRNSKIKGKKPNASGIE